MNYERFISGRANWIKGSALAEVMKRASQLQRQGIKLISLAAGDPDPNLIPRKVLAELAKEILENNPNSVMYTPTNGISDLRGELAKFLEKYEKIKVSPDNIVVTVGGSEALDLLGRVLIEPGDVVISENPAYVNTLLAFEQLGASIEGVLVDEDGMKTDLLEERIKELKAKKKKIKFIYTIPTGQNPMGVTMSEERRKELLEIASKYDLLIIEDTAYNFMKYEEKEIPSLKSLDREGRVLVAGTLSKVLGTGFRIGWIIAEGEILDKILMEKQPIDFCAPTISQFIALEYLKRGYFEKYHSRALQGYKGKRDVMIEALEESLPNARFTKPIAGMFVMLFLPKGADGVSFAGELMEKYHVVVVPGKPFYTDKTGKNAIRLNFSRPSKEEIAEGIKRLAELYKDKFP